MSRSPASSTTVAINMAISVDGKTVSSGGNWKPGMADRARMDEIRSRFDCLIVGKNTILKDNPNVSVKSNPAKSPRPVLIARNSLPESSARFFHGPLKPIVYTSPTVDVTDYQDICQIVVEDCAPAFVIKDLHKRGYESVLIEAGSILNSAFFAGDLIDKLFVTIIPELLGTHAGIATISSPVNFDLIQSERNGDVVFLEYSRNIPESKSRLL